MEHECVIGLLDRTRMVTLSELKSESKKAREFYELVRNHPLRFLCSKGFTVEEYGDGRRSTNLTKFCFCPYCGKKIDWKTIRRMKDG